MNKAFETDDEVMEKINSYAVTPMTPEQVYCFSVVLCDNDIDRDYDRFSLESLNKLAQLYVGKTGIFDHNPKGTNQTARVFDTQVKSCTDKLTKDGMPYYYLEAKAYMVRTASNADLIAEIDGGIKKEVSVSCQMSRETCSICGADKKTSSCVHIKGKRYGEKLCFSVLEQPSDVYEWSFVAVPAQVNAGVTKKFDELSQENKDFTSLKSELGDANSKLSCACDFLRGDILRLSYFCNPMMSSQHISDMTRDMSLYQLIELDKQLATEISRNTKAFYAEENSFITQNIDEEENENYTM